MAFGLFLLRPFDASVTERGIVGMLEKQQQQKRNCTEVLFFMTKDIKLGYLCTGKGASYLFLFDDADHRFKVVLFFTFLLKLLGLFVVFCYSCVFYMTF